MSQLTLEAADQFIDAALAARQQANGKPLCVIVLDANGHTIALKCEDGGLHASADIALGEVLGPCRHGRM